LEQENWRFFDDENGPANVRLEPGVFNFQGPQHVSSHLAVLVDAMPPTP